MAKLLARAHVAREILIKEAVWLENGREITLDPQGRALPRTEGRKSDDPVLREFCSSGDTLRNSRRQSL
jgi:hypothetical protein